MSEEELNQREAYEWIRAQPLVECFNCERPIPEVFVNWMQVSAAGEEPSVEAFCSRCLEEAGVVA